jgi:hypothetical protein
LLDEEAVVRVVRVDEVHLLGGEGGVGQRWKRAVVVVGTMGMSVG